MSVAISTEKQDLQLIQGTMGPLVVCLAIALLQGGQVFATSNAPEITNYAALDSRYLREDIELNAEIGTIEAHDPDGTRVSFYLLGPGQEYFEINKTSGVVKLKKLLDFDIDSDEREIRMTIRVVDEDLQEKERRGKVFVLDVNDIKPVFERYDIFKTLDEDSIPGIKVADINVDDEDTTNDILSVECYSKSEQFADACDKFALEFIPANISNIYWRGKLVLAKQLDYEQRISYAVKLVAKDGKWNVTNEVHIEVGDINDSPPVWTLIKPITVNEELAVGTYVTTVTATDGDVTNPRNISYEIIEGGDKFSINNETGEISNAVVIDFDHESHPKGSAFEVKLKAREIIKNDPLEIGNDTLTTSVAVVSILVKDIDDNKPKFDKDDYLAFIPENIVESANIPGLQMTITDIDSGKFNSFELVTLRHQDIFDIIPNVGKANAGATLFIKDSTKIDYENGVTEYIIPVEARENQVTPALTGSATVTIRVTDINDQPPVFGQQFYFEEIPETSPEGKVIIDLDATDTEAGKFGTSGIRYKMFGNQQKHFHLDELTGVITVGSCNLPNEAGLFPCIDYERKAQYVLTVSATDNLGDNKKGKTRSVQVFVTITDENDNIPKPDDRYTAYIYEEKTVPVQPLIIKAEDPDTVGGPLTYQLSGPTSVISNWKIEIKKDEMQQSYGIITAKRGVLLSDATDQNKGIINFQVLSQDTKSSVSSEVDIYIIDINNNAPKFEPDRYEESIREDTKGEVLITSVTASDGDSFNTGNGILDFSIKNGSLGKFTIKPAGRKGNKFLAEVYTTQDATFNFDVIKRFELTIQARDQGTPQSEEGTSIVIVNIIDVNNNVPKITPTSVSIAVPENRPVNTNVHEVIAIDPDQTKDLRYYMTPTRAQNPTGGAVDKNVYNYEELFRIDEKTGIVRVNKGLNRELTSFLINTLTVVDIAATPKQTGTGALFITITEVNDQDPVFDLPFYNITIDEELNINYFVRNLHCSDEDDKIKSYSLSQREPRTPNYFTLVDNSGALIISNRIDFEILEIIKLEATCGDDGTPGRFGTTDIVINIRNINDNSPAFKEPLYKAQIYETKHDEYLDGKEIATVSASDIDKGDFGDVLYKMVDPNEPFQIDEKTGVITIKPNKTFDRETKPSYGFQVIAYDSPKTPSKRKETRVPVYVTILDINDNCPEFSKADYEGSIPENANTGTDVIDIIATDKDVGPNKRLAYTIQPNSFENPDAANYFGISIKSGRVYSRRILTEKSGKYRFNVTATDTEGELPAIMCSSHVPVVVTVSQSQNYAPNWIRPPQRDFIIYILESQYEGMLVYNSKANDSDPGPNGIIDYFFVERNEDVSATNEFRINQVTGVIRAEIVFDREQVDTYFLTLVAKDQGNTRAKSETTLTVVIMDVDDNDPVFEMKDNKVVPLVLPEFELIENQVLDTSLGRCKATDADSDHKNNKIYYKIISADEEVRKKIAVDANTCEITLNGSLDYEIMPQLEFSIYAYNKKNEDSVQRHKRDVNPSILPVVIRISDDNDNPPEFTEQEYFSCTSIDAPFQSSLVDLDAYDVEDTNLMYTLINNTDFIIDKQGIVHNNISFPSTSQSIFAFDAYVNDSRNTDSAKVNVFVTSESNQVILKVNRPSSDIRRVKSEYVAFVVDSSKDIQHACIDIKNHINDDGTVSSSHSDVYIAVVKWNTQSHRYEFWAASTLYKHFNQHRRDDASSYDSIFVTGVSRHQDDELSLDEDVVLAILIVSILLLALAILLFILACYCIWEKKKKKIRKIKAQRHIIVQASPHTPQESFENPVYHNSGFVNYEDDYSMVSKPKKDVGPIVPVVVPAPENLQPLSTFIPADLEPQSPEPTQPENPEPVIETEVMPTEEPILTHTVSRLMEPEYEDRIETEVIDDHDNIQLPDPPAVGEIDTEIRDDAPAGPVLSREN